MVLRKPYAFLIKNFKKIHIILLVLSFYVAFKMFDVSSYVNDFIRLGTYDFFGNPITKHINFWLNISLLLLFVGSISLLLLLRYKHKPWKIYLVPIIEYLVLFFVLSMIKSFFNGYSDGVEATDVRLSRDLLMIFAFGQIGSIGVFLVRVLGLDMRKFQFNIDDEFLELSEEDREEFEIGLNFDKYSIIRGVKRLWRNIKYVYLEHKLICNTIAIILSLIFLISTAKFIFITNKSYSQGESYSVNGYTFTVNNVYYTDKDYRGNIIEKDHSFVIIDLTIKNHQASRNVYLENFHIKNGTKDYVTTKRLYATEFQDLGNTYESTRKINKDESLNLIIIYNVSKRLRKNRFVLYYQEKSGTLRKIKLKVQDISKIVEGGKLSVGDEIALDTKVNNDTLRFDNVLFLDKFSFSAKRCKSGQCVYVDKEVTPKDGYIAMGILFYSENYDAKNMIDFLKNYGKLNYRDSEDEEYEIDIENATSENYGGKVVYLKVPVDVQNAKEVYLDLLVRNKHYTYNLYTGGTYEGEDS